MNEQNLIRPEDLTPSERRESASRAGKASGEARRRKKDMKQKMKALLELPAAANDKEQLEALGVDPDDMDNEMKIDALYNAFAITTAVKEDEADGKEL